MRPHIKVNTPIQAMLLPPAPRVACRACLAVFEDSNGHRLCDTCLVDRVNGAGELELDNPDDVINWPAQQVPSTARITCRICEAKATVPVDHPALLCPLCLEDLEKTRIYVQKWLASVLAALDEAKVVWEEALATSPARERWPAVQDAIIAVAEKRMDRSILESRWRATLGQGGPMAELLRAYEAYAAECDRLALELARLERAQAEINQACSK